MDQLIEMVSVSKQGTVSDNERVDTELIKRSAEGDKEAFTQLFMKTYRYSYFIIKTYLNNDEDVYDALQDTYTKIYTNISRLKSFDSFYPWMSKIAENSAKDIYGKRIPTNGEDDDFLESVADNEPSEFSKEVMMDVTAVLQLLPKEDAELLAHVYYDGFTVREVARMQGVAATTVYSRLNSAKRKLKAMLKIKGIEKPLYGGDIATLVATAIRNAIGSNLLSAAVAQEILQLVTGEKSKSAVVLSAVAKKQRDSALLKIASLAVLLIVLVSVATVGIYLSVLNFNRRNTGPDDTMEAYVSSDYTESDTSHDTSSNASASADFEDNSSVDGESSVTSSSDAESSKPDSTSSTEGTTSETPDEPELPDEPTTPEQPETLPDIDLTNEISNVAVLNSFGNSSNNLNTSYGGTMVHDGDWFYYFNHIMVFKTDYSGGYGKRHMYISENGNMRNLNVMNGYVMLTDDGKVIAIDVDSFEYKTVSSFSKLNNIYAIDGKLYATVGDDPNAEVYVCDIGVFEWKKVGKGYENLYFTDDGKAVFYKTQGQNGLYNLYRYDLHFKTSSLIASDARDGDIKTLGEYVVYPGVDSRTGQDEMRLVSVYHPNKIIKTYAGNTCCYVSPYNGGAVAFEMGRVYYIESNTFETYDTRDHSKHGQTMIGEDYFYFVKEFDVSMFVEYELPDGWPGNWICDY